MWRCHLKGLSAFLVTPQRYARDVWEDTAMTLVMGADPHLDTFDIAVVDELGRETHWAHLPNDRAGWNQAASIARDYQVAMIGIEAASGYGRRLATCLAERGHAVVEVPTRATASVRGRDGQAKTDRGDARAIARAAAADHGYAWTYDPALETVRVLIHRRRSLVATRSREINQLRALLTEIDPARAAGMGRIRSQTTLKSLSHVAYRGDQHRHTVAGLIRAIARSCLQRSHEISGLETHIGEVLPAIGKRLMDLPGVGLITAATLIAEMAGTDGFATDAKLAAWAGTAPLDASSGRQQRHRLNPGGNRQANMAIHMIALTQSRHHQPARTYIARRTQEGKTRKEALRALKRHITRTIWKTLHT